jgi:hypothetical protein
MTEGQLASSSRCQVISGAPDQTFCHCKTVGGLVMWDTLSDKRTVVSLLLVLASAVIFTTVKISST